jgi:2-keto-4-pentenoate hydratase/2-oxohepta-3-ene-1,7-dioic acid hydratase in catechol pathway
VGLVVGEQVFDLELGLRATELNPGKPWYDSLLSMLRAGPAAMVPARRLEERLDAATDVEQFAPFRYELSQVKLWAPVPRPNSIRDFLVFEEHLIQSTQAYLKRKVPPVAWLNSMLLKLTGKPLVGPPKVWYEIPIYYKGNADSVVGHDEPVVYPSFSKELDYELEFGVYL